MQYCVVVPTARIARDLNHPYINLERERETERTRRGGARLGNLAAACGGVEPRRPTSPADFVNKTSEKPVVGGHERDRPRL